MESIHDSIDYRNLDQVRNLLRDLLLMVLKTKAISPGRLKLYRLSILDFTNDAPALVAPFVELEEFEKRMKVHRRSTYERTVSEAIDQACVNFAAQSS